MRDRYDFSKAKRGAVLKSPGKTRITIMLDSEIIESFRESAEREGVGYQTKLNSVRRGRQVEKREVGGPADDGGHPSTRAARCASIDVGDHQDLTYENDFADLRTYGDGWMGWRSDASTDPIRPPYRGYLDI